MGLVGSGPRREPDMMLNDVFYVLFVHRLTGFIQVDKKVNKPSENNNNCFFLDWRTSQCLASSFEDPLSIGVVGALLKGTCRCTGTHPPSATTFCLTGSLNLERSTSQPNPLKMELPQLINGLFKDQSSITSSGAFVNSFLIFEHEIMIA